MNSTESSSSMIALSPAEARNSAILQTIFILNFAINMVGALLHCSLILVTVLNRNFHSSCHLLIACNSLSAFLAYLLVLTPLVLILLPKSASVDLSLLSCFRIQLVPLFATFHVFSLMAAIGIDRLLSAFWPIWYMRRNDRVHFLLLLSLSALFPLSLTALALFNVLSKPDDRKLCTIGDLLGRQSRFVPLPILCCILLSVSCYLLVWLRLKQDIAKGQFETVRFRQPIFRSLCIILSLQVCGWLLGQLIYAAVYGNEGKISPLVRWQINGLVTCFLSLIAALDVPVLFATSSDYNIAFRKQFPRLTGKIPRRERAVINRVKRISQTPTHSPLSRF